MKAPRLQLAPDLTTPIDLVTETIAVLGIRGSGKTNTAVVIAEELLAAGQQVVVIDPTNVWWGLKSSADGAKAGYPVVVLGGRRGDVDLAASDGKSIADFVVDRRASVVLSTRHFVSKADARRFITDFANRLYYRKGQEDAPTPIMVIVDEASLFVPQRVMGEDAKCVAAIQALGRQGRSSGIGLTLIDQRAASVNKDVLSMLELLVCHRTTSPQDRKALTAWVEQHDADNRGGEFLDQLASLPRGTAWFWSPGWLDLFKRVDVRKRRTFDSSATPKAGETITAPTVVAPVDLDALRTALAATIEKAQSDNPEILRKRIAVLETDLRLKAIGIAPTNRIELAEAQKRGYVRGRQEAVQTVLDIVNQHFVPIEASLREIRTRIRSAQDMFTRTAEPRGPMPSKNPAIRRTPEARHATVVEARPDSRPFLVEREPLTGPEQRIVDAIAWMNAIGVAQPDQRAVAFLAGYAGTGSGAYRNPRAKLNAKEFVRYVGDAIELTESGRYLAQSPDVPGTNAGIHAAVLGKIGGPERRLLTPLLAAYPRAIRNHELAREANYGSAGSGAYRNPRARLRSFGLIEYVDGDAVRAVDILFPQAA
jgi:hypothetical protein